MLYYRQFFGRVMVLTLSCQKCLLHFSHSFNWTQFSITEVRQVGRVVCAGPGGISEKSATLIGMDCFFPMAHVFIQDAFWPSEYVFCFHDLISELSIAPMLFLKRPGRAVELNEFWPARSFFKLV